MDKGRHLEHVHAYYGPSKGEALEAHLFVPTRAIGFVEIGQEVRLQYDAFDYRTFGLQQGHVQEISATPLLPSDTNQQILCDGLINITRTNPDPYDLEPADTSLDGPQTSPSESPSPLPTPSSAP